MKTPRLQVLLAGAALVGSCGKAPGNSANGSGTTTTTQQTNTQTGGTNSPVTGDTPGASGALAATPGASDLAGTVETQAQLAADGQDSVAAAAATGGAGSTGGASLALTGFGLDITVQPAETTTGQVTNQDCYLGPSLPKRTGTPTPWPESADASSVFADSKTDPTTATNMFVEPALLQFPVATPTTTLTLSGSPFAFTNLVEVILKISGQSSIQLADPSKTNVQENGNNELHRFWVPKTGAAACGPAKGADALGTSGSANGRWFMVKWSDDTAVNGLSLVERVARSATQVKTYYPVKKGAVQPNQLTLDTTVGRTGYRLVQWTTSAENAAVVAGAAVVRQKVVTHSFAVVDQITDGLSTDSSSGVKSDLSHQEEVRATDPLTMLEYRDANDVPLEHVVQKGTIFKTAKDGNGVVRWFSTLQYNNVKFDLVNSSDPCIPTSGTATMTVFSAEGGTQLKQIVIQYNSSFSSENGKVDPGMTVTGSADDSTAAQWMMLHVNRKCDLRD